MSALDAARRFRITARRAKDAALTAAESNPLTSALIGATVAGGLWLAHSLYTEETDTCDTSERQKMLDARKLDSRDSSGEVISEMKQDRFNILMDNWTNAAALYSEAAKRKCHEAQYALGRLCYEGRGYVYDPEYGIKLYEQAALAGNKEAMIALAHIALDKAQWGYDDVPDSESALGYFAYHDRTEKLYEGACLLRRALGREKAIRALHEFNVHWGTGETTKAWTSTWEKDTYQYLVQAAIAHSPVSADPQEATKLELQRQVARSQQITIARDTRIPVKVEDWKEGGWREGVYRLTAARAKLTPVTWDLNALLEASRSDTHQKASTASAVLLYLNTFDSGSERAQSRMPKLIFHNPDIKSAALNLIDEAASEGDVTAIETKVRALGYEEQTIQRNAFERREAPDQRRIGQLKAEIEQLLTASAGSRALLHELGSHIRFTKKDQAKKAYFRAAELGHWEAMLDHRSLLANGEQTHLIEQSVLVVPIPADLVVRARPQGKWIRPKVNWPDVSNLPRETALSTIKDAFHVVLTEAKKEINPHLVLILEPIDPNLLGTHDPYELMASAIMNSDRSGVSVALCVFDDLSVVASYDKAFAKYAETGDDTRSFVWNEERTV